MFVIESQYFNCISSLKALINQSHIKIEAYESFKKMSFRNRCVLASDKGLINLSVPLRKGREQKCLIKEVEIDDSQLWRRQHWKSICSCYRKAPFFDFYAGDVERLIFAERKYLLDLNMFILYWIKDIFRINAVISFTEKFIYMYEEPDVLDMRNRWLPKNFQKDDIPGGDKYEQVFESKIGFQPNLSVLDLIFCEGPNAVSYIKGKNA